MSLTVPKIKSWIRVDPLNKDDLKEVRALVPDEEVEAAFGALEWSGNRAVVILFENEEVSVLPETVFDAEVLPTLDAEPEPQEPTRVEVAVFEFLDDWEALGHWSSLFGDASPYPFEGLQYGDLIMFRGGGFEIFSPKAEAGPAPVDEAQLRLQVLSIAISAPRYGNEDHKKSTVEYVADLYSWVRGS